VHRYGPHIFHTSSRDVFDYLSRFTAWRSYQHRVLACVDGQLVPMPINLDTINRLYGTSLTSFQVEEFLASRAEKREPRPHERGRDREQGGPRALREVLQELHAQAVGPRPLGARRLGPARVPVRTNRDDRYFTDTYQAMPLHGYTRMFEKMLDHPNIKVMLNTDYREIHGHIPYEKMIYTGPIDAFFDHRCGKLPYRSLEFEHSTKNQAVFQPAPVVNYPNEYAYTRVTEFKYLTGQEHPKTSIVHEYPRAEGDPYYPVPRPENAEIYRKYEALAAAARTCSSSGGSPPIGTTTWTRWWLRR
jgi:UDP-galactopyranose mutase